MRAVRVRGTLVLVAVMLLAGFGVAYAQTGASGLRGKITDAQGAVIPGATVSLANPATGFTRDTVTDASGDYQFVSIPPGTYTLKVELTGFRTAIFNNVPLPVDTTATQNVKLEIGELSETVEVTAETTVINTTDASMGNVISGTQVRMLPLEARSVVGLLSLQPGAVFVPTNSWGALDNRSGAVSGARADQANVTLDGVDNNDPQYNTAYTGALRSTLDSLQEFRVTTSNYGAESGRSSSAQVSLVTKSGTNDYHGAGYYVFRRTETSANEYFNKLAGNGARRPRPTSTSTSSPATRCRCSTRTFTAVRSVAPSSRTSCSSSPTTSGSRRNPRSWRRARCRRRRCVMA
ncbi:MAG: Outer rane receptor for ferrienterochelin and colicin [Acidobacteria bacterium]|nr:Outer rane receptor for ferrienterochelin and colicin [Acidobacteriota bacterium]